MYVCVDAIFIFMSGNENDITIEPRERPQPEAANCTDTDTNKYYHNTKSTLVPFNIDKILSVRWGQKKTKKTDTYMYIELSLHRVEEVLVATVLYAGNDSVH